MTKFNKEYYINHMNIMDSLLLRNCMCNINQEKPLDDRVKQLNEEKTGK